MKKNILLLMALSAGALTVWSQEPSYQSGQTPMDKVTPENMSMSMRMPETLNIFGVECRLDKYVQPNQKMEEYIFDGNTIVCNRYDYDWTLNDWVYAAKSNSVYDKDGRLILFESFLCLPGTTQWVGSNKHEYEYDIDGHIVLAARYGWSGGKNDWYCQMREESVFGPTGYKISCSNWTGSESSSTLKGGNKTEVALYENGSVKDKTIFGWDDQMNDWVPFTKESYTYNQRGNTSSCLVYAWNPQALSWEQSQGHQYDYRYGVGGKKTSVTENVWDKASDQWEKKYITTYGYDHNGCKTYRVRANATDENPLAGFEKDTYEYNELNQVVLHYAYESSKQTKELWLSYKDEYTYDDDRNVSSFTRYKWNEGDSECFGWQKWERDYTADRKPSMKADYRWDNASKSWVGKCRQLLAKDELGLDMDLTVNYSWTAQGWKELSYVAIDFDHDNFVATVTEYESGSDNVISKEYYFYSPVGTTGLSSPFERELPAFNIEGNRISSMDNGMIMIYSIDGKLLNSAFGSVEAPSTGFYIVKVGDKASKVFVK